MQQTPTIAIVDDDDGVRASLVSLVRSLGYAARSYPSGRAFLDDAGSGDPGCLITDVQMPQMTGDGLQAALVAARRSIPMIFMTAFPTEAIRERVMAAGARCFLEKPIDGDVLARHLADLFEGGT